MQLILDYAKWRCGGEGDNQLGEGDTLLCNEQGFMCCLGQFSLQKNQGLYKRDLFNYSSPEGLEVDIPGLTIRIGADQRVYENSSLSSTAMQINDNTKTTPAQKIEQLKELFSEARDTITVINQPTI